MQTITMSQSREKLASVMDNVVENHSPVIITRQNHEPVVMISLSDFRSYEETAYLMQSSKNATRLNDAINQLENGGGTKRDLIEDD